MAEQLTLFDLQQVTSTRVPVYTPDPYWDSFNTPEPQNPDTYVREQVTDNTAHEHSTNCSRTHFVEVYWVKRKDKKYYYYRYTWMEGRKMHRHHIGSISSKKAIATVERVRKAIAKGAYPQAIVEMITV